MADAPDARLEHDRIALAVDAFVWILGEDPRVQRAFAAWLRRLLATATPIGDGRTAVLYDVIVETARQNQAADLASVTRLVTDDLGLGIYATWLPSHLLVDFAATFDGHLSGQSRGLRVTPAEPPPSHRSLRYGGQFVADYVRFYYRAEIKNPPDTPYTIAKERRDRLRADGQHVGPQKRVSVGYVTTGIADAKRWLTAYGIAPKVI